MDGVDGIESGNGESVHKGVDVGWGSGSDGEGWDSE